MYINYNYYHFSRLLYIQLLKRGYNANMLRGIIRNVAKIERKSLLPYKSNDCNFLNNNSFFIFLTFDCNYNFLRSCLYNYYSVISQKYICTSKNKLVLLNRIKTNIGSLLIHNFFLEKSTNCKYKK